MATDLQRQGRTAAQRRGQVAFDLEEEGVVSATSLLAAGAAPKACRRAALKAVRARPTDALSWATLAAASLAGRRDPSALSTARFACQRAESILRETQPVREGETLVQRVEQRRLTELRLWCLLAHAEADLRVACTGDAVDTSLLESLR